MGSIVITRPILIKIRVTENYKKEAVNELQQAIQKIDFQLQQLEFQHKRIVAELEKQDSKGLHSARQHVEEERQRHLDAHRKMLEKIKEIGGLAPGEEVIHGRVESMVELKVGDDWQKIVGVEVVLEDGVVSEIRGG